MAIHLTKLLILLAVFSLSIQQNGGPSLGASQSLKGGQSLISNNGGYQLVMESSGQAVLYMSSHRVNRNILWSSKSARVKSGPKSLILGTDGNLVIWGGSEVLWTSNTINQGAGGYYLLLQNDANLVIYDRNNKAIWASNTMRI